MENTIGKVVTLISLLAILMGFFYNVYCFNSFPPEFAKYLGNTFIGKVSSGKIYDVSYYIGSFVILHLVRIHFGLNFISYDESFAKVLANMDETKKKRKAKIEFTLRIILLFSLQILNFILWRADYSSICIIFLIQGIIIMAYNFNYWEQLFKRDLEYKANYFILIGDITFIIAAILLSIESYFWFKKMLLVTIGGYISIFIGEFFSQYLVSLKRLFIDIKKQVSLIYNNNEPPNTL